MTRLTGSEGFASSGAGADFSFASNDFKTLGAFFCNFPGLVGGSRARSARPRTRCCGAGFRALPFPGADSIFSSRCGRPGDSVLPSASRAAIPATAAWRQHFSEPRSDWAPVPAARVSASGAPGGEAARLDRLPVRRAGSRQPVMAVEHAAINSRSYPATTSTDLAPLRLRDPPLLGEVAQLLAVGLEIPRWLFVVIDRLRYPAIGSGLIRRPYHRYVFSERNFRIYSDSVRHRERQRHQAA